MKKAITWLAIISITIFVISWAIGGLMIYDGDYENNTWVYIGLVSFIVFFSSLLYLKTKKCQHCGKIILTPAKFCPHCGKEIR